MPYTWYPHYIVYLKTGEPVECLNMLVIENEDIETIMDIDLFVKDVIPDGSKISYEPSEQLIEQINYWFKYNLLLVNCKNLRKYSNYTSYKSKNVGFNSFYFGNDDKKMSPQILKGSTFQSHNKQWFQVPPTRLPYKYALPFFIDNIFISNCNSFDISNTTKIDKYNKNRTRHINDDGSINIDTPNCKISSHRRPLHKRYQYTDYIYYWDYHNIYIDGVQVIDPELPTFKKVQDEVADLKKNFSLLMDIVKSQKEELDALKSVIVNREDDNDRLTDELKYKDSKIDSLERTIAVYYNKESSS